MDRRQIAILVIGIACLLGSAAIYAVSLQSEAPFWLSLNFITALDKVLGVCRFVPPAISWAIVGGLVGALCYYAIWEARNVGKRDKRYNFLGLALLVLLASPAVWAGRSILQYTSIIPITVHSAGDEWTYAGIQFAWIPPGEFMMGSPPTEDGHAENERLHKVTLDRGFWMSRYEITQAEWIMVMGFDPAFTVPGEENQPVRNVSIGDCHEFLQRLDTFGKKQCRLPTEAEWEYACRAGSKTAFVFGDYASGFDDYGWCKDNSGDQPHPVGMKKPNAWGLFDMHGNVAEWCDDWYTEFLTEESVDPTGPAIGLQKTSRGGSCGTSPQGCRSAVRYPSDPAVQSQYIGIRICFMPDS